MNRREYKNLPHVLLLAVLMIGCKSKDIYDHKIPLGDFHWVNAQRDTCDKLINVNYLIELQHESLPEKQLRQYTLMILFDDVVYNGKFRENIALRNIPICLNSGANVISIKFAIIDSVGNQVYIWQNEDSYPLDKYSKMKVMLRSEQKFNIDDGAFTIKMIK